MGPPLTAAWLPLLLLLLAAPSVAAAPTNRTQWMIDLTHQGAQLSTPWVPLSAAERTELQAKTEGWYKLATRSGNGGHLQWGQTMPQVQYADASRTAAARYDDVGDINAWTGQLLSALVHKVAVDRDPQTLDVAASILSGYNFSVFGCFADYTYVPRCWASPNDPPIPWQAWRAYFTGPDQPLNDTHGVHNCTAPGSQHILWQGDASRDTYIGVLNGLASTLLALEGLQADPKVKEQYALAQRLFEAVYDKLSSDKFWIVPPPTCSHPGGRADAHCPLVNPTASMQAAWMRVAMSVNPEKYEAARLRYTEVVDLALVEERVTPIHSR